MCWNKTLDSDDFPGIFCVRNQFFISSDEEREKGAGKGQYQNMQDRPQDLQTYLFNLISKR